jgi:MtN3 and saliva related transmembrane protein
MELELIAFIASAFGVCSCLPQILKVLRTQDTTALSFSCYIMMFFSAALWVLYGVITPIYSIVFWSSISTVLTMMVIFLKFKNEYGHVLERQTYQLFKRRVFKFGVVMVCLVTLSINNLI